MKANQANFDATAWCSVEIVCSINYFYLHMFAAQFLWLLCNLHSISCTHKSSFIDKLIQFHFSLTRTHRNTSTSTDSNSRRFLRRFDFCGTIVSKCIASSMLVSHKQCALYIHWRMTCDKGFFFSTLRIHNVIDWLTSDSQNVLLLQTALESIILNK